jgi:hypothetical protein
MFVSLLTAVKRHYYAVNSTAAVTLQVLDRQTKLSPVSVVCLTHLERHHYSVHTFTVTTTLIANTADITTSSNNGHRVCQYCLGLLITIGQEVELICYLFEHLSIRHQVRRLRCEQ